MELYRLMRIDLANRPENKEALLSGRENEARNLVFNQLMCPSNYYLNAFDFNDRGPNSFGKDTEMTKYFFVNLYDALKYAEHFIKQYHFNFKLNYGVVILQIELPEELVKPYLGWGKYFSNTVLECRLPYQLLYENLGLNNPYFQPTLDFFNQHYQEYETVWLALQNTPEYQHFLETLPTLEKEPICSLGKIGLYPYLCFSLKEATVLRLDEISPIYFDTAEIIGNLIWSHFANPMFKMEEKIVTSLQEKGDFEQIIPIALPFYEKETKKLKKVLKHQGFVFEKQ